MKNQTALLKYHVRYLDDELARRKSKNARYSLRAFASQLEMHPSALSRILAGKQELSLQAALVLVKKLSLTDEEQRHFIASIAEEKFQSTMDVLRKAIGHPWPVAGLPIHPIVDGLFETARDLLAPLSAKDVVDLTLNKADAVTPLNRSVIYSVDGEHLVRVGELGKSWNQPNGSSGEQSIGDSVGEDDSALKQNSRLEAIKTGQPVWKESPFAAYIPMMLGKSVFGLAEFSSEYALADDHRLFLISLVSIAAIAYSRALFYESKLGKTEVAPLAPPKNA